MTIDERIDHLQKHVHALQTEQADLVQQLTRARVDQWRGRVEDLQLQLHLASMSGTERANDLADALRNQWDRTQAQVEGASAKASSATETVWSGLENAYQDARTALIESTKQLQG